MHEKETHPVKIIRHELSHNMHSFFKVLPPELTSKVFNYAALNTSNNDRLICINLMGESGSGMTSLLDRFYNGKYEQDPKKIDVDSETSPNGRNVLFQDEIIKVVLFDRAWSLAKSIHKIPKSDASILVFDGTNPEVFNNASVLLTCVLQFLRQERIGSVNVVFTKGDLIDEAFKTSLAVTKFEKQNQIKIHFVSSLTGENVESLFENLTSSICASQDAVKRNEMKKSNVL